MKDRIMMLLALGWVLSAQAAAPVDYDAVVRSFRQTLVELVKADTTNPPGNEARAVKVLAARLRAVGVTCQVMDFAPGRQNLVARLKGSGEKRPLLLLAHLDVVGTDHQDWTTPPHDVVEKDGYLVGRGVRDDLGMVAANLEAFLLLKRSNVKLKRDVILAFTGDEESGGMGIRTLLEKHPEWVDAEIALNEGGGPTHDTLEGPINFLRMQVAEKTYQDFRLETKGVTGHSSVPRKNNAIYRLARALDALGNRKPDYRLLPVTRAYLKLRAPQESPEVGQAMNALADARGALPAEALALVVSDPVRASSLSTSCVATTLSAGTRVNALPASATANVNCRILPDETPAQVQAKLAAIINDPEVSVTAEPPWGEGGASPEQGIVPTAIAEVGREIWPNVVVIPMLQNGASDARFLRANGIAAYGMHPIPTTEKDHMRTHGIDERTELSALRPGLEFWHKLVLKLAAE